MIIKPEHSPEAYIGLGFAFAQQGGMGSQGVESSFSIAERESFYDPRVWRDCGEKLVSLGLHAEADFCKKRSVAGTSGLFK